MAAEYFDPAKHRRDDNGKFAAAAATGTIAAGAAAYGGRRLYRMGRMIDRTGKAVDREKKTADWHLFNAKNAREDAQEGLSLDDTIEGLDAMGRHMRLRILQHRANRSMAAPLARVVYRGATRALGLIHKSHRINALAKLAT